MTYSDLISKHGFVCKFIHWGKVHWAQKHLYSRQTLLHSKSHLETTQSKHSLICRSLSNHSETSCLMLVFKRSVEKNVQNTLWSRDEPISVWFYWCRKENWENFTCRNICDSKTSSSSWHCVAQGGASLVSRWPCGSEQHGVTVTTHTHVCNASWALYHTWIATWKKCMNGHLNENTFPCTRILTDTE